LELTPSSRPDASPLTPTLALGAAPASPCPSSGRRARSPSPLAPRARGSGCQRRPSAARRGRITAQRTDREDHKRQEGENKLTPETGAEI